MGQECLQAGPTHSESKSIEKYRDQDQLQRTGTQADSASQQEYAAHDDELLLTPPPDQRRHQEDFADRADEPRNGHQETDLLNDNLCRLTWKQDPFSVQRKTGAQDGQIESDDEPGG